MRTPVFLIAIASMVGAVALATPRGVYSGEGPAPRTPRRDADQEEPPPVGVASGRRLPDAVYAQQQKAVHDGFVATLASYVRAEFDAYQQAKTHGSDEDAARAAVRMAAKMMELADKPPRRRLALLACWTAWELCIEQFKASKSEPARRLILAEWDHSLGREEGEVLNEVLTALKTTFDRRFLTAKFWDLVEHSKRGETMSEICYILYKHGNREDLDRFKKRLAAMPFDDPRRPIVSRAVAFLGFRLRGHNPEEMAAVPNFHYVPPSPLKPKPMRHDDRPALDPDWRKRPPPPGGFAPPSAGHTGTEPGNLPLSAVLAAADKARAERRRATANPNTVAPVRDPHFTGAPRRAFRLEAEGHVLFTVHGTWNALPAMVSLIHQFEQDCNARYLDYMPTGSDGIIGQLSRRECDVGLAFDSFIREKDRKDAARFEAFPVARYVVGFFVNAKSPVRSVTLEELQRIFLAGPADLFLPPGPRYRGPPLRLTDLPGAQKRGPAIRSWREVANSGSAADIEFFRPEGFGVASYVFINKVKKFGYLGTYLDYYDENHQSTGKPRAERRPDPMVVAEVAKKQNAVGFVELRCGEQLDKRVRLLKVADGEGQRPAAPSAAAVADGSYPIVDTATLYVRPDAPRLAMEFCRFAAGPEGAKILKQYGLWPEHELEPFRATQRLADVKAGKGVEIQVCDAAGFQGLLKDLSSEFTKAKAVVRLKFETGKTRDEAVQMFEKGAIGLLLTDKDRGQWTMDGAQSAANPKSEIQNPKSVELGRMAVGIIVHPENPLESLPLDEARAAFCGEIRKWPAVRGAAAVIHVFGLKHSHPITQLLKEKLGAGKALRFSVQPDNEKIILAVARDPAAIGFVDLSQLPLNEKAVKLVPVFEGAGKGPISNPQSQISNFRYQIPNPLSRTLALYVSPKASQTAKDFADFLTPEHCKATIAQYNLLPPLHAEDAGSKTELAMAMAKPSGDGPQGDLTPGAGGEPFPLLLDDPDAPQDKGPKGLVRAKGGKPAANPKSKVAAPGENGSTRAKLASTANPSRASEPAPRPSQERPGAPSLSSEQTLWLVGGIGGALVLAVGIGWLGAPKRKKRRPYISPARK